MALDIKVIKKKNFVYSVELKGSLDNETHLDLEEELKELIDEKTKAVILDMAGLTYISSVGIKALLWIEKALKQKQASFATINLQPQVKKVLEAVKILPILNIFDDMQEADQYIDQIINEEISKEKT